MNNLLSIYLRYKETQDVEILKELGDELKNCCSFIDMSFLYIDKEEKDTITFIFDTNLTIYKKEYNYFSVIIYFNYKDNVLSVDYFKRSWYYEIDIIDNLKIESAKVFKDIENYVICVIKYYEELLLKPFKLKYLKE